MASLAGNGDRRTVGEALLRGECWSSYGGSEGETDIGASASLGVKNPRLSKLTLLQVPGQGVDRFSVSPSVLGHFPWDCVVKGKRSQRWWMELDATIKARRDAASHDSGGVT